MLEICQKITVFSFEEVSEQVLCEVFWGGSAKLVVFIYFTFTLFFYVAPRMIASPLVSKYVSESVSKQASKQASKQPSKQVIFI